MTMTTTTVMTTMMMTTSSWETASISNGWHFGPVSWSFQKMWWDGGLEVVRFKMDGEVIERCLKSHYILWGASSDGVIRLELFAAVDLLRSLRISLTSWLCDAFTWFLEFEDSFAWMVFKEDGDTRTVRPPRSSSDEINDWKKKSSSSLSSSSSSSSSPWFSCSCIQRWDTANEFNKSSYHHNAIIIIIIIIIFLLYHHNYQL